MTQGVDGCSKFWERNFSHHFRFVQIMSDFLQHSLVYTYKVTWRESDRRYIETADQFGTIQTFTIWSH